MRKGPASGAFLFPEQQRPSAISVSIAGQFRGGVVFYRANGSLKEVQFARVEIRDDASSTPSGSVKWNFATVRWTAIPRCVNELGPGAPTANGGGNYWFRVASLVGYCIPGAKRYLIAPLDGRRIVIDLRYASGLTASGVLVRR